MTGHVQLCDFAKITPLEANRLFFLSRVSRFILMNHNRIQKKKEKLHSMSKRFQEKFLIKDTWTERYRRSAIPYMQRLLNDKERKKQGILRQIRNFVPVNNGSSSTLSLR